MKYRFLRFFPLTAFFVLLFLCAHILPLHAAGGLSITEIMYDPLGTDTNREWIEVENDGSASLDLSGYFLLTDGLASSHHSLVAQGSSVIPAGGYAVIVQDVDAFKTDYPSYAGILFDSSWSGLPATSGKTIALIDGQSNVLDQVAYDPSVGGDNDGTSLQKDDTGAWSAATPTPGSGIAAASAQATQTSASTDDSNDPPAPASGSNIAAPSVGLVAGSPVSTSPKAVAVSHMRVDLAIPKYGVAGIPVTISDKVYGYSDELRTYGGTHFALGDGSAHDGQAMESFQHAYAYPGTYVVTFEYREDPYYPHDADVTARAVIVVEAPGVAISNIASDGSVTLSNTGDREADVSGWLVAPLGDAYAKDTFHIPEGTVILTGKTMTGIALAADEKPVLLLPSGALAGLAASIDTTNGSTPILLAANKSVLHPAAKPSVKKTPAVSSIATYSEQAAAPNDAQVAVAEASNAGGFPIAPFALGLLGLLGAGLIAVYKFRRAAKNSPQTETENEHHSGPGPANDPLAAEVRILGE